MTEEEKKLQEKKIELLEVINITLERILASQLVLAKLSARHNFTVDGILGIDSHREAIDLINKI